MGGHGISVGLGRREFHSQKEGGHRLLGVMTQLRHTWKTVATVMCGAPIGEDSVQVVACILVRVFFPEAE